MKIKYIALTLAAILSFGSFFNGMDYGSACVLGMGAYLCAVVVICTCIIISKLDGKSKSDNDDKKTE